MYKIDIKKEVQKSIRKLPKKEIPVIIKKLYSLQENPRPLGSKKLMGSANSYRVSKGDYRILYTIDDRKKLVVVFRVVHRKEAYRRLWF